MSAEDEEAKMATEEFVAEYSDEHKILPYSGTPKKDGVASAGDASTGFACGDHVHPTDTSRMAANATGADIAVSGSDPTKISAALAGKADSATTYTKDEVDEIVASVKNGSRQIVASLNDVTDPKPLVIYMVAKQSAQTKNAYDEYIWTAEGAWEKIGDTEIDLSGYVPKETGKGLSTNDYTTEEKTKLEGIEAGAQANIIETVKVNGTALTPQDKAVNIPVPTLDKTVTKDSANGVKSSGIWSAIWGALSELPMGVSSLYDWCVAQLAGKVPTSRKVNGKALSSDVTLDADDVGALPSTTDGSNRYVSADVHFTGGDGDIDLPLGRTGTLTYLPRSESPTQNNLVAWKAGGGLADSGKKPSDFQSALSAQQLANIAAVSNALAFDATHTYEAGDPVVYNGTLYTFTAAHTGAWTGSDVSAVDVIARLAGKLDKSGGTMTGALTVQENLTVGSREAGSAVGVNSVAEGRNNTASGSYSHAEGNSATASGGYSHAEGAATASGLCSHAEGAATASGGYSHAEGAATADGSYSHAEGNNTTADGSYSHAEGRGTGAQNVAEHAQGRFNVSHKSSDTFGDAGNTLSSIGFGTAASARKNAVETMQDGKTFIYGLGGYDGTNPTATGVKDLAAAVNGKLASSSAAPAFSTSSTYAVGEHVTYNGGLYRCTTAVTTAGAWDASKWTADMASNYFQYALVTKTIDNGAVTLDDRAINAVAVSSSLASLTVNFPTATSGKARDFGLRLTVASGVTTAPELALPQGVVCENADGEAPEIGADGAATILYFTETASGVFLVKGEVVQTIS